MQRTCACAPPSHRREGGERPSPCPAACRAPLRPARRSRARPPPPSAAGGRRCTREAAVGQGCGFGCPGQGTHICSWQPVGPCRSVDVGRDAFVSTSVVKGRRLSVAKLDCGGPFIATAVLDRSGTIRWESSAVPGVRKNDVCIRSATVAVAYPAGRALEVRSHCVFQRSTMCSAWV